MLQQLFIKKNASELAVKANWSRTKLKANRTKKKQHVCIIFIILFIYGSFGWYFHVIQYALTYSSGFNGDGKHAVD